MHPIPHYSRRIDKIHEIRNKAKQSEMGAVFVKPFVVSANKAGNAGLGAQMERQIFDIYFAKSKRS